MKRKTTGEYRYITWKKFRFLGNLNFSITLLLSIGLLSALGTIIEQNKPLAYYQDKYPSINNNMWHISWKTIIFFKLHTLYTNYFFLGLIALFSISLIICTLSTQLPSLRHARTWKMKTQGQKTNKIFLDKNFRCGTLYTKFLRLQRLQYYVFYQDNKMYAYKGIYGRLSPIIVHISMIILIIGFSISTLFSFYIQEMIPVGETFNLNNTISSGPFSRVPEHITGVIKDFRIEYYNNRSIKQFYTSIQLEDHLKHQLVNTDIKVNQPLQFEGLTIYQTDWKINGIRVRINDKYNLQLPTTEVKQDNVKYWVAYLPYDTNQAISLIISGLDQPIDYYMNNTYEGYIEVDDTRIIDNIQIQILGIITSTGLQIKGDQGINIVYLGFGMLMISTIVSYISFSQIWLVHDFKSLHIYGKTNRGTLEFEQEVCELIVNDKTKHT
uniref:Cytochrome c biogenesis protein Ccs1 n=1 Tax=Yamadaella caenomyce TaxID=259029 RepID=A0A1G4NYK9_9FLOR|nr:Cytochrome c biogenesis protein ccs1 [Yamadaella caenomyce]SCW23704.1 Cytochrome c biogenesis protein ccs1 [Yamadaella caenomyce]